MNRKIAIAFLVLIVTVGSGAVANVKAESVGTIFINADGSVSGTNAIQREGTHYYLTQNLYNTSIVVLCNNITLDGGGFTLQGPDGWPTPAGINLTCTGVTVQNFIVKYWEVGILGVYDDNTVSNNSVIGNERGIAIYANNYSVCDNYIARGDYCIRVVGESDVFYQNTIDNWGFAFWITDSSNTTITDNSVTSNNPMVFSTDYGGFQVYHNNFYNMRYSMDILLANANATEAKLLPWDNGYPSGGNYWSDYTSIYPNATEIDNSGIGDTPYNVTSSTLLSNLMVLDRYPLMSPVNIPNLPSAPNEQPQPSQSPTPSSSPTSTPTTKPNSAQKSTQPNQMAATVVEVLVVVIAIILAVFLLHKKRSKTQLENPQFAR